MNKQELIKEIKCLDYLYAKEAIWVSRERVLDLIEQLDETTKTSSSAVCGVLY